MRAWTVAGLVVLAVVAVFLLQVGYALWVFDKYPHPHQMDTRGQFGDLFGAVNAFFTGLAFAGVIFTISLQRRELYYQRQELELTTKLTVIAALVDAYTGQIATMEQGKFRGDLWVTNTKIKKMDSSWAKVVAEPLDSSWAEVVAEPLNDEEAVKVRLRQILDCYIQKDPESKLVSEPQFRPSFEAWVYARRRRNQFLAMLERMFKELADKFKGPGA